MSKVIRHGKIKKIPVETVNKRMVTCPRCECIFIFDEWDIDGQLDGYDCVTCPECGEYIHTYHSTPVAGDEHEV